MLYHNLPPVGATPAPDLKFKLSPNHSVRSHRMLPEVLFNHTWGGGEFHGVVEWLCNPKSEASAHIVYAGAIGPDKNLALQLVPWSLKAWTECTLNDFGVGLEFADAIWTGHDPVGFAAGARMSARIMHELGLPPRWVRGTALIQGSKGHARHADGGRLGCGHLSCPTTDLELYGQFHNRIVLELRHGKFPTAAYGRF